jgi:hypothetical protein
MGQFAEWYWTKVNKGEKEGDKVHLKQMYQGQCSLCEKDLDVYFHDCGVDGSWTTYCGECYRKERQRLGLS